MSTKRKRTYSISQEAVATVKRLIEERHLAPSEDALVEQAIVELTRRVQDADDAHLWHEAQGDSAFQEEAERLNAGFAQDDLRAWDE